MKFQADSTVAEQTDHPRQCEERPAHIHDKGIPAFADNRAFASTVQRFQNMADTSPRALHLRQREETMTRLEQQASSSGVAQRMLEPAEDEEEKQSPPAGRIFNEFMENQKVSGKEYGQNCACSDLADALVNFARSRNASADTKSVGKKILVGNGTAMGGKPSANTACGKYWFFTYHVFAQINGEDWDPTFVDGRTPSIDPVKDEDAETKIGKNTYVYYPTQGGGGNFRRRR